MFQNLNILPKSWNSSSNASTSSLDWRWEIGTLAWSQFCAHTRFWTMRGERELRNGSTMRLPVLNADSDARVETSIASTSLATLDNSGYLLELSFLPPQYLKFTSLLLSQFLAKYFSTSLLQPTDCSTSKKSLYQEWTITYGSLASPNICVLSLPLGSCTFGELTKQ